MRHKAFPLQGFKALSDEGEGVFEAIVAVFGNVDRVGDKILPGAFEKSLAAWAEKDRQIPVIFSHNWDDLDAHIGHVMAAEEREEGLYVKGQLDIEEEFARKVWRKMSQGLIADFSFAYDEIDAKWIDDVHELHELDILEVGPTLVGANPATHLLGIKGGAKAREIAQSMHDMAVELGAECSGHDADPGGSDEGGGDEGQGGDDDADRGRSGGITPRNSRRSLLAARMRFGPLV